ncbi:ABC-F family ATP-binding cassette domain-containing protein [Clostridium sp. Marseille-P2415]|uniref:ABC-F family ATP-binding cassette domain-containing protein n=1 Tax=Clostridium sp. Marseille-P2415 TaxID=1805471 RepID=UPI0009887AD8|nr:ABC-F family ATP-binding cassette domain-containing protein [Clostridium sp. Marseille-P2415]
MLYQIKDGTVTAGGNLILSHIDFEIHGKEKIAVVGNNGAGKTTLLRLIAGELDLDRDDRREGPGILCSGKPTVGYLKQQAFADRDRTVWEELLSSCPCPDSFAIERFEYEREYDTLFTGLGFSKADKKKKLSEFSGGEQTKIALIRHLLLKPDILLLDEPTNHLDIETTEWLEQYMKQYEKAVVMVSHDRFFLDQTVSVVYELSGRRLTRYPGNYTHYREEKGKAVRLQTKAYERQQEEIRRLEAIVERFKNKPNKAAFARSKKKAVERIVPVPRPEENDIHMFTGPLEPAFPGSKWVFESEHLKIGYDKPILEITMRIRRGQKIGILGSNGAGKSTFLKTAAGLLSPVSGEYSLGNQITIGYFDQHSSEMNSTKTVAEHFHDLFPSLTEKEVRSILGAYLFGGKEAGKRVDLLSGGEKSRLVLAELLQSRPNFLILDEPTNHMDIRAKETLESAFRAYTGTILFVSHDRYFLSRVAESVLIFEDRTVFSYPFGYEHYLERRRKAESGDDIAARMKAEEQALIAGMRAVPKAERHRLKEIPVEEAYLDWKLGLVLERLLPAKERVEELSSCVEMMKEKWMESEEFWNGGPWEEAGDYERLKEECQRAWEEWEALCLEWYDTAFEETM